jgi:hypothetical protein
LTAQSIDRAVDWPRSIDPGCVASGFNPFISTATTRYAFAISAILFSPIAAFEPARIGS